MAINSAAAGLIGILEYIEQVERMKKTAPFKVPEAPFRLFQEEAQGLPGLDFNLVSGGDDVWAKLQRLKEELPPEPQGSLKDWLILGKSPDTVPTLRKELVVSLDGREERIRVEEMPELQGLLQNYLLKRWTPWSIREKPRRKSIALYAKLFALQQAMSADDSDNALEIVWGMGLAIWKKQGSSSTLEYPLITQACEISLNTLNFDLEIRPRDLDPGFELDAFVDMGVNVIQAEAEWKTLRESAQSRPSPFEASSTAPILRGAVGNLDAGGRFAEVGAGARPAADENLLVTDTWVLFVRKRAGHILLQDIERLKRRLEDGVTVPPVLESFVVKGSEETREREGVQFRGLSSSFHGAGVRELFFPMPYNDEQVSIIEKLETNDGVVVQGPPGTGKTHTIANVICHYLAQGKRVLVTSKGEEALRILQEKIPEEVRPLTVALLTTEREGMKQFEHSIQTIASRVGALSPRTVRQEIEASGLRLNELHQQIAAFDRSLTELAEKQLSHIAYEERQISPEALARLVLEEEPLHNWLVDELLPGKNDPTFSNEDVGELRAARVKVGTDLEYLDARLPAADSLPVADTLLQLHHDLVRAREIDESVETGDLLPLIDQTPATFELARALAEKLQQAETLAGALIEAAKPWTAKLLTTFRTGNPLIVQALKLAQQVNEEDAKRRERLARPVALATGAEVNPDVVEAVSRLVEGRSGFGFFGKKEARALIAQVTVAGVAPANADDWKAVSAEIEHRVRTRNHISAWNALAPELGIPDASGEVAPAFRQIASDALHLLLIQKLVAGFERPAAAELVAIFGTTNAAKLGTDPQAARTAALKYLGQHLDKGRLAYATARVSDVLGKLTGMSGPVVEEIRTVLSERLGTAEYADAQLLTEWRGIRERLVELASLRTALDTVVRVTDLIESSGARHWAKQLRTEPATGEADALTPGTWLEAWRWRAYTTLLNGLEDHARLKKLFEKRSTAEKDLARTYQEHIAARTWLAVHEKSPDRVRQELQRYLNSVQAMGAGTGVRAERHRRNARSAMKAAYQAVPCWILPTWRVSETIPSEVGLFDLVVIDESSQSDIWALPALLRGKKVLVVGDHKQVSPSAVGVEEESIRNLHARHLRHQPYGSEMTPDKSIYDLARVVFAGNSVMLREHFRCVPAIIEYSNRHFYEGEIRPLRIPKHNERLDPPLIDVFVEGGYRQRDVNEPEAKAILAEIKSIIADPSMKGKSIGVVTLLGQEQPKRIDDLIRQQIDPHEIIERRIRVGAPPVFQGREADIMLLSLVTARGERGVANRLEMQQRFNVAASRARDRMILVRSIEESDVNPDSLQAELIRHFRQPFQQDTNTIRVLRDLCESDFEREMFDEIVKRNYRIRPQVKVGGYRIDLVIEGAEDRRLAVECDGDRWHGPGQWADDMTRQRVLERAGWTFWRCFASSFVLKRRAVLDDLFGTLTRMGIDPLGSETVDSTQWTARRNISVPKVEAEDDDSVSAAPALADG